MSSYSLHVSHLGAPNADDRVEDDTSEISAISSQSSQEVEELPNNLYHEQELEGETCLRGWSDEDVLRARAFAVRELSVPRF